MSIKRYFATKDTTITNAFKANSRLLAGQVQTWVRLMSSEVFSIYGQSTSASLEKSRMLTQFSTTNVQTDRTAGTIPASGSVNFYLRLYNAKHAFTLPREYDLDGPSRFTLLGRRGWLGYGGLY